MFNIFALLVLSKLTEITTHRVYVPLVFLISALFGSLFSALFILYFKSSNHFLALFWSLGLGFLLVANEYIDHHYHRFTLTWALFGLCAILVFNFILPF